jgi:Acetyltransferase (GNAT) domain
VSCLIVAGTRLIAVEDAPALAGLVQQNREFMADWDPIRPEGYFTPEGQRRAIEEALHSYADRVRVPHVILDGDRIVGRVTLSNIVRGPFQSCNLGYWVNQADNGRGLAIAGVTRRRLAGTHALSGPEPELGLEEEALEDRGDHGVRGYVLLAIDDVLGGVRE